MAWGGGVPGSAADSGVGVTKGKGGVNSGAAANLAGGGENLMPATIPRPKANATSTATDPNTTANWRPLTMISKWRSATSYFSLPPRSKNIRMVSMGSGKTMVVFFSAPISVSVWR